MTDATSTRNNTDEFYAKFRPIKKLLLDEFGVFYEVSNKELAELTSQLVLFQEQCLNSKVMSSRGEHFTKLPHSVMSTDTNGSVPLANVLIACHKYRDKNGANSFDLVDTKRLNDNLTLFKNIQTHLTELNILKRPCVFFEDSVVNIPELSLLVEKHGGSVTKDRSSASHIIIKDVTSNAMDTSAGTEIRALKRSSGKTFIHWWFKPDSMDCWVDTDQVDNDPVLIKQSKGPQVVTSRFITDTDVFNEWMNPLDYSLDSQMLAHKQSLRIVNKDKVDADASFSTQTEPKMSGAQRIQRPTAARGTTDIKIVSKKDDFVSQTRYANIVVSPINNDILPKYCKWFNSQSIDKREERLVPKFFQPQPTPATPIKVNGVPFVKAVIPTREVYKQYRDWMVSAYHAFPDEQLTFASCRRNLSGDCADLMAIYNALEYWGLINYNAKISATTFLDKGEQGQPTSEIEKVFLAQNNVRNPRPVEMVFSDATPTHKRSYDRHERSPASESTWTDQETLKLLEGIEKLSFNWDQLAEHVETKTREECFLHFLRLPIEDEFLQEDLYDVSDSKTIAKALEEGRKVPFVETANPVMTLVTFLSSTVSSSVAAAAAQGALESYMGSTSAGGNTMEIDSKKDEQNVEVSLNAQDREAFANAIAHASIKAKELSLGVEASMAKIMAEVIELKIEKVNLKMEQFETMTSLLRDEQTKVDRAKEQLYKDQATFEEEIKT